MTLPPLADLIPHAGAMVLLDRVIRWDENGIACLALTHRSTANPLRRDGRLAVECGVEYAAQAMAVHGALLGGQATGAGVLASVRDLKADVAFLDDLPGPLTVEAWVVLRDAASQVYRFSLSCDDRPVLRGQAAVFAMPAEEDQ